MTGKKNTPAYWLLYLLGLLCAVSPVAVDAQLCTGSLGDPVVNITFGPGGSAYSPTNAYIYTGSTCPDDGYYTITRSTSGCFGNTWHTVNSDHTGNGLFMLVNASYNPGDFFSTTVSDLCPNTTYEFAAWVMNVMDRFGLRPDLTFSILSTTGDTLAKYNTGLIIETSEPQWKQYGFYFTTLASNATIVLKITNNAPGGNGNDLALDDITFRPCGPTITAHINGSSDTVDVCEGNTNIYTFQAEASAGYSQPVYQWQVSTDTGATWTDIAGANSLGYTRFPTTPGRYWYRMNIAEQNSASVAACHISSNYVVINVHAPPVTDAGPDRVSVNHQPVILGATVTGEGPQYTWQPTDHLDNSILLNPSASPTVNTIYTLYATSAYGCKSQDDVLVKVVEDIFIPNAFSPNGDGMNDTWRVPFLDPLMEATVYVYNRQGQLVYRAEGGKVNWDGNLNAYPQPAGAYVYSIIFRTGFYRNIKGSLLLIR